jgi:23S rRNA pseudouridine1911/1915/1917 synthase
VPAKSEPSNTIELIAEAADAGKRIDRWLAEKIAEISRARLQALIRDGHVSGDRLIREVRTPVKSGTAYTVNLPPPVPASAQGESLPLKIVHEDDSLIVVDKAAGLVVHPAAGHASGTLVNALIAHCGDRLSGIGGVKRPGIVHRLDKDTSGLLVVAKTDAAHQSLASQFESHGRDGRLHRSYLAFVWGRLPRPKGTIDVRLARSRANRTKIAVVRGEEQGRAAVTHYEVVQVFPGARPTGDVTLLRLTLETGRTHQIRVHLSHIGHPVIGDPVYGPGFKTRVAGLDGKAREAVSLLTRQALHAEQLRFEHPESGRSLIFTSELPADLENLRRALLERSTAMPTEKMLKRRS